MDIYDIPIAEITKQYIGYIEMMQKMNLEVMSEFLVLAATLIEIKSKMLLPKPKIDNPVEEEEDPRLTLIEQILEYKKFKSMAEMLKEKEEENLKVKSKVQEDLDYYIDDHDREYIHMDLDDFIKAFNLFLHRRKKIYDIRKRYQEIEGERISIEEKTEEIKIQFRVKKEIAFFDLLDDIRSL